MTVSPEYSSACISHITTPVRVWAFITPTPGIILITPQLDTPAVAPMETPLVTSTPPVSSIPVSSIITLSEGLAIADPVIIGWQDHDLEVFPSDYATSLARRIGVPLPTKTAAPNSTSPTSSKESDNLSTGAKAGIGVGVTIGMAVIGIVIACFLMHKRRKMDRDTVDRQEVVPEAEEQEYRDKDRKWFFGGKRSNEVHAEAVPNELDSNQFDMVPTELDSRLIHVVPGSPVELDGSTLQRSIDTHEITDMRS